MLSNQGRPISSLRRLRRASQIADGLRPKSYSGGTQTIGGVVYRLHPTKGYRKDSGKYAKALRASTTA